ncbi:MAG TPA: phosphotransferase [Propionicimonas sp.]|nr:phosphotransferase [Propionicimonas sp.]
MANIPGAEVRIDAATVTALLRQQAPHLADLPVQPFGHGWDNEIFAVGPGLLARFPRRRDAATLIEHEIGFVPRLAIRLPAPVPVPVFAGRPGLNYPWRWTVVPRLPGTVAAEMTPADRSEAALGLAAFLAALHTRADSDAPTNLFRGVPLVERAAELAPRVAAAAGVDALAAWQRQVAAPRWPRPPVWTHGDLHPMNVLLDADHGLAGVIDFGDVCAGDPAGDLAVAWLMFDATARDQFRACCAATDRYDPGVWGRAWAWALALASMFSLASDDMPPLAAIARHGLAQTLSDPEFGPAA